MTPIETSNRPAGEMAESALSIIVASYNDARIAEALDSVLLFDDIGTVRLVIIDGGSKQEVRDLIARRIRPNDVFISERDGGIFDALNKGLENCSTPYIGWLGSDDLFTGCVRASDVIAALQEHDLYITNLALFRGAVVRRITHALPSRLGLVKYGFNNPHFATFGTGALLKSERFRTDLLGSDIEYFLRIFARRPKVKTTGAVGVLMREGGFSTGASRKGMRLHYQLLEGYAKQTNSLVALLSLMAKTIYKLTNETYHRLRRIKAASLLKRGNYPSLTSDHEAAKPH